MTDLLPSKLVSIHSMGKGHHEQLFTDNYVVRQDESCLKNTVKFMGYGTAWGTAVSIMMAHNYETVPRHVSFLETAGRSVVRYIFPAVLIGATFASTTCLLDSMRGRDKIVSNGILGGAMAGIALGTKTHSPGKLAKYGLYLGLLGGFARLCAVNGYYRYSPEQHLEMLSKSLPMSDVKRLAPNGESASHE